MSKNADASRIHVRVQSKTQEAQNICSFELVATQGGALPAFTAGSHVDVITPSGLTRQYSLCNSPNETHRYLIGVLLDANSRGGSSAMHAGVQVGDTVTISPPKNHFALAQSASKHVLVAGGIGITPILAMAEDLSNKGDRFELHYCTRSQAATAFYDRIKASAYSKFSTFYVDDGDNRIDLKALFSNRDAQAHVYVCGPQGFMDAVLQAARTATWPEAHLHYEFFTAPAVDSTRDATEDVAFEVEIASSRQVVQVPVGTTIVQALSAAGVDIPTSCEQGICGTCLTNISEGVPDHRDSYLTDDERLANNQFLPCCSRAKSSRLVLDL